MSTNTALRTLVRLAAAAVISGALTVGGTATASAAPPPLHGASFCGDIERVFQDRSAFPAGQRGDALFKTQQLHISATVTCLVNAERTARGIPQLGKAIGVRNDPARNRAIHGLSHAASGHASDAVSLRWWGTVRPGKNCRPFTAARRPDLCDPHVNPVTGSTPESRLQATGWLDGCRSKRFSENTYTGVGSDATPRAAVTFWMESSGHAANILDENMRGVGTAVVRGSADADTGSTAPAATFVQMFGVCDK